MSRKSWVKWVLLLTGSSMATFAMGNYLAEWLLKLVIGSAVAGK